MKPTLPGYNYKWHCVTCPMKFDTLQEFNEHRAWEIRKLKGF